MAKQNKGRKFFAASATAALVAAAIVPAASAAESTTTIKDFDKVSDWAKEDVKALVEAGIISGDEKGNFNPTKSITRAETAKIFKEAFELEAEGDVDFKDVKKDIWYYDAVAAVVENGIFEGLSATEFGPAKNLTRSEAAKILVEAFELEGEADLKDFADASTVKEWAKSSLEVAVANGIIKGVEVNGKTNLNPNASITRQEFAAVFNRALENEVDNAVKVDKVEVVDAKTLNVTLTDGTKETITLEKALEPNKETEVTFKIKDVEYKAKVTYVVTTATAVKSVSATNLKQVVVEFDGKVDPATAGEKGNYTLTGNGSPEVDSVIVAEDGRTVTLNIKDQLENQVEYKLAVNNIKAGDKVINAKDVKFKPLDNTVPTVAKVEALGNKTIRVHFSEPVKSATTSQFKIDGKVVVGNISTNLNTVIIKLSSALPDGEHTLTAEGTQDYNNFKTVQADTKFNVVEDKTAPTVTSVVSASFEKVVLKFSEPVEQVFASNIYWMQGGAKKQAASVKPLTDDTYEFTFTGDNKLVYTTDLYVTNVKDYSGNVIDKDTKVQVTPVVDLTRPEVISAGINKDNNKQVVIKFTKSLDQDTAKKAANYVIKDKDGKVQPISTTVDVSKDKEVTLTLLGNIKDNADYTLTITGVADNTTMKNVMLPYTTTLSVKDVTPPKLEGVTLLNKNQIYVSFNEVMATSGDGSIVESDKYEITDLDGKKLKITGYDVTQDAKGVILTLNENIALDYNVKVSLVKDLAGNHLEGYTQSKKVAPQDVTKIETVKATAKDKVEVEFNNAIQSLNQGDFKIAGYDIAHHEISSNGKTVTFTLKTNLPENVKNSDNVKLTLKVENPSTVDVLGKKIDTQTKDIDDKIKATVKEITKVEGSDTQIKITFNEAVQITNQLAKDDFVVLNNLDDEKQVAVENVTQDSDNKSVILTLAKPVVSATVYSAKEVRFVKDFATPDANAIAEIEKTTVELGKVDKAPVDAVVKKITDAATQAQIEEARAAYTALTADQKKLVTNETDLQTKEQKLVNDVTLTVGTAYTAANAGTKVAVDTKTGFTFAIKSSSDELIIKNDGEIVTDGTATLTYTVTHTASGKTAEKTVAVTVNP
ncbi:S-layer protein [Lysinibacillus sphaericus]|uniref:S-layer homology domain-containing protein n=1 Tax=Lysinibacillus sphaericus TaxID=1421 RepID=UPI0018CFBCF8|nr:S-layer homology domain-containing protein [Lysinibacillus sphaericus]MBG9454775.1 S-layer protein [Lysinibacillus sphaericus]MBG9478203.1 S-layer protein [Lysinibacillus sphaericus]MBG9590916.1 S-layer protein [Lysinibacillus sphaericus]